MRLSRSLPFALFACAVVPTGRAQGIQFTGPGPAGNAAPASPSPTDQPAVAAAPVPPPPPIYTEEQIAEEVGWVISKRTGLANFELTPGQLAAFAQGFALEASRHNSPYDVRLVGPQMNAFMLAKQSAHVARVKQENDATAAVFFAKLKADPTVKETPSGLCYQIFKPGVAPFPGPTDVVLVNYVGRLLNGTVFDTSLRPRQPGAAVVPLQVHLDGMIPGWTGRLAEDRQGRRDAPVHPGQPGLWRRGPGRNPGRLDRGLRHPAARRQGGWPRERRGWRQQGRRISRSRGHPSSGRWTRHFAAVFLAPDGGQKQTGSGARAGCRSNEGETDPGYGAFVIEASNRFLIVTLALVVAIGFEKAARRSTRG